MNNVKLTLNLEGAIALWARARNLPATKEDIATLAWVIDNMNIKQLHAECDHYKDLCVVEGGDA